jgi:hypothetical protein
MTYVLDLEGIDLEQLVAFTALFFYSIFDVFCCLCCQGLLFFSCWLVLF